MSVNQADQQQARAKAEHRLSLDKLDTWQALVQQACQFCTPQIDAFSSRLSHDLFAQSENASDPKLANLCFHGAQLLKNNAYSFYYLSSSGIEKAFKAEVDILRAVTKPQVTLQDEAMSLVSFEEMELKLSLSRASRSLELSYAEPLAALNMRLASLLGLESIGGSQNPFRPEVFLRAFNAAWIDFNTEVDAHALMLPMISEFIFDLAPVYQALNDLLIARGILPDLQENYRLKRKQASAEAERVGEAVKNEVAKKLEQYFAGNEIRNSAETSAQGRGAGGFAHPGIGGQLSAPHMGGMMPMSGMPMGNMTGTPFIGGDSASFNPASSELFQYLADVQKNMAIHQLVSGAQNAMRLSHMRQEMPNVFHSGVEKHTFDLLSHVFDGVLGNQEIADPIKNLISSLQVPVLKAALIDKNFFFQDAHPARRLIELLSKYSASLDPKKGEDDPLFQAMQRNVLRVQKEFDQELGLFDEVVTDLEAFIQKDEAETIESLQAPINRALQKEKFKQAGIAAGNDVSLRIGSGEVMAFVETFLENRWIKVLTLAYSVKDEKPHAVEDAIKTMDDLIWSIKPKITLAQRQEMINRLPGILARLNKWLSLIKWEDVDRVQFFADLAECHASIVRAPLELSPERQVEIAVEAAKLAAERRLQKRAEAEAKAVADAKAKTEAEEAEKARLIAEAIEKAKTDAIEAQQIQQAQQAAASGDQISGNSNIDTVANGANDPLPSLSRPIINEASIAEIIAQDIAEAESIVASLERGVWIQLKKRDNSLQKVRLAWISPMRSLFIFTSSQKEKSFSVSVDELERNFRERRAQVISMDKVVDRALLDALNQQNQPDQADQTNQSAPAPLEMQN
nr:DUF1631 family protein [uncultured Undibacterium sp.]